MQIQLVFYTKNRQIVPVPVTDLSRFFSLNLTQSDSWLSFGLWNYPRALFQSNWLTSDPTHGSNFLTYQMVCPSLLYGIFVQTSQ